jgi:membrane-bound lytic murein transglycosylase D
LAITSFNFGMGGTAKAVRKARSRDLSVLLKRHRNGSFGFAVKNYYAEFVAALNTLNHREICFPDADPAPAWRYDVVTLPTSTTVEALVKSEAVNRQALGELNPALTEAARASEVRLPRGMTLRVPPGMAEIFNSAMAMAPKRAPSPKARVHRVRRGDTVSRIAQQHGVSVASVIAFNNLRNDGAIYPNMLLKIPPPGQQTSPLSTSPLSRPAQRSVTR